MCFQSSRSLSDSTFVCTRRVTPNTTVTEASTTTVLITHRTVGPAFAGGVVTFACLLADRLHASARRTGYRGGSLFKAHARRRRSFPLQASQLRGWLVWSLWISNHPARGFSSHRSPNAIQTAGRSRRSWASRSKTSAALGNAPNMPKWSAMSSGWYCSPVDSASWSAPAASRIRMTSSPWGRSF